MSNVQALANYVPAAWRAYQHLEEIQSLQQRAQPHLQALLALAPEAQKLYKDIFPDVPQAQRPAVVAPPADRKRAVGVSVKHLQEMLNHYGANLKVDGDYGDATHRAIKKYQQDNGLEPDGWAGNITLHHLYNRIEREAKGEHKA